MIYSVAVRRRRRWIISLDGVAVAVSFAVPSISVVEVCGGRTSTLLMLVAAVECCEADETSDVVLDKLATESVLSVEVDSFFSNNGGRVFLSVATSSSLSSSAGGGLIEELLSSRLITAAIGTSNAFVTNFSSKLAGSPFSTIFLALWSSSSQSFSKLRRYIFSSPA